MSMGTNKTHFLRMSGFVSPGKRKEFEQTFRFVSHQLSPDCQQFSLYADIFIDGQYHFYTVWSTAESLDRFCKSQEFRVVEGAYKTLGSLENNTIGELIDVRILL